MMQTKKVFLRTFLMTLDLFLCKVVLVSMMNKRLSSFKSRLFWPDLLA